jgi:hypothetical protein
VRPRSCFRRLSLSRCRRLNSRITKRRTVPKSSRPGGSRLLRVAPTDALDVLLSPPKERAPGLAVGASLRFFGEVARLALELVARGRLLPTHPMRLTGPVQVSHELRLTR